MGNIARLSEGESQNTSLISPDTYVVGSSSENELLTDSNPTPRSMY